MRRRGSPSIRQVNCWPYCARPANACSFWTIRTARSWGRPQVFVRASPHFRKTACSFSPRSLQAPGASKCSICANCSAPRVLFASDRNGEGYQIFVMNMADRTPIALTDTPTSERYPRWSRDGRRIAFVTTRNGKPRIGIMDRNGQHLGVFEQTDPVSLNVGSFSPFDWSPDGERIVFVGDAHRALRTLDIATGAVTTILDTPVGEGRFAHFNNVSWPRPMRPFCSMPRTRPRRRHRACSSGRRVANRWSCRALGVPLARHGLRRHRPTARRLLSGPDPATSQPTGVSASSMRTAAICNRSRNSGPLT